MTFRRILLITLGIVSAVGVIAILCFAAANAETAGHADYDGLDSLGADGWVNQDHYGERSK